MTLGVDLQAVRTAPDRVRAVHPPLRAGSTIPNCPIRGDSDQGQHIGKGIEIGITADGIETVTAIGTAIVTVTVTVGGNDFEITVHPGIDDLHPLFLLERIVRRAVRGR